MHFSSWGLLLEGIVIKFIFVIDLICHCVYFVSLHIVWCTCTMTTVPVHIIC